MWKKLKSRLKKISQIQIIGALFAAAMITSLILQLWPKSSGLPASSEPAATAAHPNAKENPDTPSKLGSTSLTKKTAAEESLAVSTPEAQFIAHLQDRFGPYLDLPKARVHLLEKLLGYLKQHSADAELSDTLSAAKILLEDAFPGLADLLVEDLQSLLDYQAWLKAERYSLANLSAEERRQQMWAKREQLFGPAAYDIWQSQWQAEQFATSVAQIEASETSLESKLRDYVSALKAHFSDRQELLFNDKQQELSNRFLRLDSIQAQLRQLEGSAQVTALAAIRRQLGMDEAAIDRWRHLDRVRQERRLNGNAYMLRRKQLEQQLTGQQLESALEGVRQEFFGAEAEIIAAEEAQGYFRFSEAALIGIN